MEDAELRLHGIALTSAFGCRNMAQVTGRCRRIKVASLTAGVGLLFIGWLATQASNADPAYYASHAGQEDPCSTVNVTQRQDRGFVRISFDCQFFVRSFKVRSNRSVDGLASPNGFDCRRRSARRLLCRDNADPPPSRGEQISAILELSRPGPCAPAFAAKIVVAGTVSSSPNDPRIGDSIRGAIRCD